jgi:hypothetical protein
MVDALLFESAWSVSTLMRRSRNEPSWGEVGGIGSDAANDAANRSSKQGKWRYSVARATFAERVTESTVTALGPSDRSSEMAASSRRARDSAGRGSQE